MTNTLARRTPGIISIPFTITTAAALIAYLGNMVERGLIARDRANRVYNELLRMGDRAEVLTRGIRNQLNNMLHGESDNMGIERGQPRQRLGNEVDDRQREIQSLNDRGTREIANRESGEMTRQTRRNPATTEPPTPRINDGQPEQGGKSFYNLLCRT